MLEVALSGNLQNSLVTPAFQTNLSFTYDYQLTLTHAGITAIYGNSGEGKTTFLRLIAGLEKSQEGSLLFKKIAKEVGFDLPEGIYLAVLGPSFETPAEIKAFKLMGADVVAMSVVPEVIVAKHCGLKVTGFAAVTNMASGITDEPIAHEDVLVYANKASEKLIKLVELGIERLALKSRA